MKLHILILIAAFSFACAVVHGFPFEEEEQMNLSAEGVKTLEIDCGSGYLKVKGVEGLDRIEVKAVLVVKGIEDDEIKQFKEKYVKLSLEKKGSTAMLISEIKSSGISSLFKHTQARIDLDVRLPKSLALDIDDGSGSIEVSDIDNSVKVDDGSGSIEMDNIKGDVSIDDGSGSIDLVAIGGSLEIEDGSGFINVKEISGDVSVDDGSGPIDIKKVGGSVVVGDGSGSINIDGVEKDVTIKRDGSGSVSILNVNGKVKK